MKTTLVRIHHSATTTVLGLFLVALAAPLAMGVGHSVSACAFPFAPLDSAACLASCLDSLTASPPAGLAGNEQSQWQTAIVAAVAAPLALTSVPLHRRASRAAPHAPPLAPLGVRLLI